MKKAAFGVLFVATILSAVALKGQAQTSSMVASFKVGAVTVAVTGTAAMQTDGGFKALSGPAVSCTLANFHATAAGATNSDAVKDRLANVLLSAQLSGRTVLGTVTRNASGTCFLEQASVINAF